MSRVELLVDDLGSSQPSETAERVARHGWLAKGVVFVVIGLLGIELARRGRIGDDADQTGALAAMSDLPLGRVLVLAAGAGLALFALWQVWSAVVDGDRSPLGVARRLGSIGLGFVYAALAVAAIRAGVVGSEPNDRGGSVTSPDGLTSRLLEVPLGRVTVGVIGLVTIAVALYHLVKGWRTDFLDDIDHRDLPDAAQRTLVVLGVAGFTSRAIMLAVAGALFVIAGWRSEPERAAGLDQSLRTLLEAPGGRALLGVAALGLVAGGTYDALTHRRQRLGSRS